MTEVFVNDFARRKWVDGISLRLPGIVARPLEPSGLLSAFMSEIFWALADGREFVCPTSEDAVAWWMSVECCVDNLRYAAGMSTETVGFDRALPLPVLRFTMGELVNGLARKLGADRRALVTYEPNEQLETVFGRFPPLDTCRSEALGFQHDGTLDALIDRVLASAPRDYG
jgi:nucleoside-diphosphate-sugar epimerase